MKEIIIFSEKYGNRYFDASTEKLRNAACLSILKERLGYGWYDWDNEVISDENILSEEQIDQLPTESLKSQERQRRLDYLSDLRQHKKNIDFYERAKSAVKNEDGEAAYKLLLQRDGGEYESFDVIELEEA